MTLPETSHAGGLLTTTAYSMFLNSARTTPFSSSDEGFEVLKDTCNDGALSRDRHSTPPMHGHTASYRKISSAQSRLRSNSDLTTYQLPLKRIETSCSIGTESVNASPSPASKTEIRSLQDTLRRVKRKSSFASSGAFLSKLPSQAVNFFRNLKKTPSRSSLNRPERSPTPSPPSAVNTMDEAYAKSTHTLFRPNRSNLRTCVAPSPRNSTDSRSSLLGGVEEALFSHIAKPLSPRVSLASSRPPFPSIAVECHNMHPLSACSSLRSECDATPSALLDSGPAVLLDASSQPLAIDDGASSSVSLGPPVLILGSTSSPRTKPRTNSTRLRPLVLPLRAVRRDALDADGRASPASPHEPIWRIRSREKDTKSLHRAAAAAADTPHAPLFRRLPRLQLSPPLSPSRVHFASTTAPMTALQSSFGARLSTAVEREAESPSSPFPAARRPARSLPASRSGSVRAAPSRCARDSYSPVDAHRAGHVRSRSEQVSHVDELGYLPMTDDEPSTLVAAAATGTGTLSSHGWRSFSASADVGHEPPPPPPAAGLAQQLKTQLLASCSGGWTPTPPKRLSSIVSGLANSNSPKTACRADGSSRPCPIPISATAARTGSGLHLARRGGGGSIGGSDADAGSLPSSPLFATLMAFQHTQRVPGGRALASPSPSLRPTPTPTQTPPPPPPSHGPVSARKRSTSDLLGKVGRRPGRAMDGELTELRQLGFWVGRSP